MTPDFPKQNINAVTPIAVRSSYLKFDIIGPFIGMTQIKKNDFFRIRETLNHSTCADSSINTKSLECTRGQNGVQPHKDCGVEALYFYPWCFDQ